jgi:hypothetical protein
MGTRRPCVWASCGISGATISHGFARGNKKYVLGCGCQKQKPMITTRFELVLLRTSSLCDGCDCALVLKLAPYNGRYVYHLTARPRYRVFDPPLWRMLLMLCSPQLWFIMLLGRLRSQHVRRVAPKASADFMKRSSRLARTPSSWRLSALHLHCQHGIVPLHTSARFMVHAEAKG